MAGPVIDRDRGFKRIVRLVRGLSGKEVTTGIHKEEGGRSGQAGLTNAELGTIHEFGAGNVPERSFVRSTFDEEQAGIKKDLERAAKTAYDGRAATGALLRAGEKLRSKMILKIKAGIPPPGTVNNPPLIDTGQMLNSIKAKVR